MASLLPFLWCVAAAAYAVGRWSSHLHGLVLIESCVKAQGKVRTWGTPLGNGDERKKKGGGGNPAWLDPIPRLNPFCHTDGLADHCPYWLSTGGNEKRGRALSK